MKRKECGCGKVENEKHNAAVKRIYDGLRKQVKNKTAKSGRNELLVIKPCPFCSKQPKTYWDFEDKKTQLKEGFNIVCCNNLHITAIYKEDAMTKWNERVL